MTSTKETFGQRLNRLRDERGLSIRQLAKLSGVNYTNIWEMCNDRTDPRISTANKFAEAFQMDLGELLGGLLVKG